MIIIIDCRSIQIACVSKIVLFVPEQYSVDSRTVPNLLSTEFYLEIILFMAAGSGLKQ